MMVLRLSSKVSRVDSSSRWREMYSGLGLWPRWRILVRCCSSLRSCLVHAFGALLLAGEKSLQFGVFVECSHFTSLAGFSFWQHVFFLVFVFFVMICQKSLAEVYPSCSRKIRSQIFTTLLCRGTIIITCRISIFSSTVFFNCRCSLNIHFGVYWRVSASNSKTLIINFYF